MLLLAKEVAEHLRLPIATVYEHARTGLLPAVHVGRAVRFRAEDIEHFLEQGGAALEGGWKHEVER